MNSSSLEIFLKILPVLLLIVLGFILQKVKFFKQESVADIKKIITSISLPSVLFMAFSTLQLELKLLVIVAIVFSTCIIMVGIGKILAKVMNIKTPYFALLFGGFEAGMMGYSIFISVYGADNVDKFAITDLGQVIFVFFVLMAGLTRLKDGVQSPGKIAKMFVTSPIIISIFLGIAVSLIRFVFNFTDSQGYQAITSLLDMLGNLTVPLICIIIGYELKFSAAAIRLPIITIALRIVFLIILALLINEIVYKGVLNLEPVYRYALMTMFILPPPFVMPLFLKENDEENRQYIVNTLSMSTIFSIFIFIFISLFYR